MQIAVELAKTHEVTVSISHPLTFYRYNFLEKVFFNLLEKVGLLYAEINTKREDGFRRERTLFSVLKVRNLFVMEQSNCKKSSKCIRK